MERLELYKRLLRSILDNYSGLENDKDDYKDCVDMLDDDNIVGASNKMREASTIEHCTIPVLNTLANFGGDSVALAEEIPDNINVKLFIQHPNPSYKRRLEYYSENLNVVETELLYKNPADAYSDESWRMLECIFVDSNKTDQFLTELKQRVHSDTYNITVDEAALHLTQAEADNSENLYAYALASLLNKKQKLEIPSGLILSTADGNPIIPTFDYNKEIVYNEYYDIYDALNDLLHAGDILTAFMKMYQIVEYMIYRTQLVEITNSGDKKQSFLRAVKNLNSKYTKNERDTIISNFPNLFNSFSLDPNEISATWPFVDKYFGKLDNGGHYLDSTLSPAKFNKGVARFIYDTRCAIVHNKESEFHILYNNYDEYKDIVPLMNSINKAMIKKIIEIINNPASPIHYASQKLNLY